MTEPDPTLRPERLPEDDGRALRPRASGGVCDRIWRLLEASSQGTRTFLS